LAGGREVVADCGEAVHSLLVLGERHTIHDAWLSCFFKNNLSERIVLQSNPSHASCVLSLFEMTCGKVWSPDNRSVSKAGK
jgi:hypothetical protein